MLTAKFQGKMEQLPLELIEKILSHSCLSIQDAINFSSTCSHFHNSVLNSTTIWKHKYYDNWPQFVELFTKNYNDYLQEIQYIYDLKKRTQALLETMPSRFYKKYELSDTDLEEWAILLTERKQTYHYLVLDLMEIVNTHVNIKSIEVVPLNTPGNKTLQYYAGKVLRYVKQIHLTEAWIDFISLPPRKQILERGAVFVAQWCQPNIKIAYEDIAAELDYIASQVVKRVLLINPNHPLLKASTADLEKWRSENLDDNQWKVSECQQLIWAMRDIIYCELGFSGNNEDYYIPQNSFINNVLETKKGLPITLAVVYESVGRRLGLLFEPISFPAHFLLRFTESQGPEANWYYIDVFNEGNVVQRGACPHSRFASPRTLFPVASPAQVVERMANNLELAIRQHIEPNGRVAQLRSILELLKLVSPQDLSALVSLAKLYMLHNMNTRSLEHYISSQTFEAPEQAQKILHMLRDFAGHHDQNELELNRQVQVAQRTSNIKFAVGMIMTHTTHNYKCVIYDWDLICLATAEWQTQMAVDKLTLKHEQPFYNVLVEDGSYRYVAQEALLPISDVGLLNLSQDLGRHFSHFFENHFVPNAEKDNEYPADRKVRHKFYHEVQLARYRP